MITFLTNLCINNFLFSNMFKSKYIYEYNKSEHWTIVISDFSIDLSFAILIFKSSFSCSREFKDSFIELVINFQFSPKLHLKKFTFYIYNLSSNYKANLKYITCVDRTFKCNFQQIFKMINYFYQVTILENHHI